MVPPEASRAFGAVGRTEASAPTSLYKQAEASRACGAAGRQHPQGVCHIRSAPDGADGCAKSSAPTQGRKRPEFHTSNIQRAQTERPVSFIVRCGSPILRSPVRAFGLRTEKRKNAQRNDLFFCAQALFPRLAPLFCILFSGKTEKSMPAERQLRLRNDNGTAVQSQKCSAPLARSGGQRRPPLRNAYGKYAAGGTVAVSPQKRNLRCIRRKAPRAILPRCFPLIPATNMVYCD